MLNQNSALKREKEAIFNILPPCFVQACAALRAATVEHRRQIHGNQFIPEFRGYPRQEPSESFPRCSPGCRWSQILKIVFSISAEHDFESAKSAEKIKCLAARRANLVAGSTRIRARHGSPRSRRPLPRPRRLRRQASVRARHQRILAVYLKRFQVHRLTLVQFVQARALGSAYGSKATL